MQVGARSSQELHVSLDWTSDVRGILTVSEQSGNMTKTRNVVALANAEGRNPDSHSPCWLPGTCLL